MEKFGVIDKDISLHSIQKGAAMYISSGSTYIPHQDAKKY